MDTSFTMKYIAYRFGADLIFCFHLLVVLIALFGWVPFVPWELYMSVLVTSLISGVSFGHCILSKWEFDLRRAINPSERYDYSWTTYYTYKLTDRFVSKTFFERVAFIFVTASIGIDLSFRFIFYTGPAV